MNINLPYRYNLLVAAILSVFVQLGSLAAVTQVLGHTQNHEIFILILFFLGLITGQSGLFSIKKISLLVILLACFELFFGLSYGEFITWAVSGGSLGTLIFITYFFTLTFVSGFLLSYVIYQKNHIHVNYFRLNLFAALFVLLAVVALSFTSQSLLHGTIGILLTVMFLVNRTNAATADKHAIPAIKRDLGSLESIVLGAASGIFVHNYLFILSTGFYPNSFTYAVYLFLSLSFLALASISELKFLNQKHSIKPYWLVGGATLLHVMLLLMLYGGSNEGFYFTPFGFGDLIPAIAQNYWFLTVLWMTVLFLPYLFFAFSLPTQERRRAGNNHVLLITVGNVIGLVIGLSLGSIGLFVSLCALWILVVLLFVVDKKKTFTVRSGILGVLAIIALLTLLLFLLNIEKRVIIQGLRFQNLLWNNHYITVSSSNNHLWRFSLNGIRDYTTAGQERGYLVDTNDGNTYFGLGGYRSLTFSFWDLIRAETAREVIGADTKRVLILGLGNHLILTHVQDELKKQQVDDYRIEVVDNFSPLKNDLFRSVLAEENSFLWEQSPEVTIVAADAFHHILEAESNSYDVIVWNLTLPSYNAAKNLYTQEVFNNLQRITKPNGYFITSYFNDQALDCLPINTFTSAVQYPARSHTFPEVTIVASALPVTQLQEVLPHLDNAQDLQTHCGEASMPNLSKPYTRLMSNTHNLKPSNHEVATIKPPATTSAAFGIYLLKNSRFSQYPQLVFLEENNPTDRNYGTVAYKDGIDFFFSDKSSAVSKPQPIYSAINNNGTEAVQMRNLAYLRNLSHQNVYFVSPTPLSSSRSIRQLAPHTRHQPAILSLAPIITNDNDTINSVSLWPTSDVLLDSIVKESEDIIYVYNQSDSDLLNRWLLHTHAHKERLVIVDELSSIPNNIHHTVLVLGGSIDHIPVSESQEILRTHIWVPDLTATNWNAMQLARHEDWQVITFWDPFRTATACSFTKKYVDTTGMVPSTATAFGYSVAELLSEHLTIEGTRSIERESFAYQSTLMENLTFTENGDRDVTLPEITLGDTRCLY